MPELPEVERARRLIAETCTGWVVEDIDTVVDTIVYDKTDNVEFTKELVGRTVTGCERKGKQFWMTLSGDGRYPVMHFGMTGMIQLKGQEPTWYRKKIHLGEVDGEAQWPPKFYKFVMKLASPGKEPIELAFIDPRRLGRLRLVPDPVLSHPPLSELGFDPILSHPTLDEFKELVAKKKGTIKGLIMDQAFSAGVGNWVADEVLYQAHIHPMCPVPALTEPELVELHRLLRDVPLKAIEVNADSLMFPDDWLFRWRWDKGKKKGKKGRKAEEPEEDEGDVKPKAVAFLALPDGTPATISFVTVGGRTSAIVNELQKMPTGVDIKAKVTKKAAPKAAKGKGKKRKGADSESDLTELSSEEEIVVKRTTSRSRGKVEVKEEIKVEASPRKRGRAR